MKKIVLYSTHCPNCMALENELKKRNIEYEEINDIEIMKQKGFMSAPMLEVNGEVKDYTTAIKWIMEEN